MAGVKDEIAKNLLFYRKQKKMTQKELADCVGVKSNTISSWESGTNSIDIEILFKVCSVLDVPINDIYGSYGDNEFFKQPERDLIKKYRALDEHGKDMVDTVLAKEAARVADQRAAPAGNAVMFHAYTDFYQPSSAGTGQQAGSGDSDKAYLKKPAPRGTDYIVRVSGDSMEPDYHDGDRVFVQAAEEISPGEVGIFYMDGRQWIKQLGDGVLISRNPRYDPLPFTEDVRCQGKVLGVCDESYF